MLTSHTWQTVAGIGEVWVKTVFLKLKYLTGSFQRKKVNLRIVT